MATAFAGTRFALVRASSRICAVPLAHVLETMRPLPVRPVQGSPPYVSGLAVVRGSPIPVVDLGALLGGGAPGAPTRFLTLRVGDRRLALAVDGVLGIRELEESALERMPPLLRNASRDFVESIGTLDSDLLVVLRASRILPEESWPATAIPEEKPCP